MKYSQVILASLVLFATGGAGGYFLGLRSKSAQPIATTSVTSSEKAPWFRDRSLNHFVDFLEKEIQIDESQKTKIVEIINQSNEKMKQIWDDVRPKAAQQMDATNVEIKAVMTSEQVIRFDQVMEEFRKQRFRGPPRGSHPNSNEGQDPNRRQERPDWRSHPPGKGGPQAEDSGRPPGRPGGGNGPGDMNFPGPPALEVDPKPEQAGPLKP